MRIKKLNDRAEIPKYQTSGAVAFDLANADENILWEPIFGKIEDTLSPPIFGGYDGGEPRNIVWKQLIVGYQTVVGTGLAFEVPEGTSMNVLPRSGWGFKHNIQLGNGTGVIDRDYRGEVKVKLIAFCDEDKLPVIEVGTRIAQAMIVKVENVSFEVVDELSDTERGEGGFGSTGHNKGESQ